jgi:predicted RNA-binding Zn-ribbon protein involved in translation (DUF1610 family)
MWKDGRCPQCGSSSVFSTQQGIGWDVFLRMDWRGDGLEPFEEWSTYLCADCGLFENHVTAREYLDAVKADPGKAGWAPVAP